MSLFAVVSRALALLSPRDRRLLALVGLAQIAVSVMDLIGVLLLGLVAAAAAASVTGASLGIGERIPGLASLTQSPSGATIAILAGVAGLVLITKSIASLLITRRVFQFLANRQAMLAGSIAERLFSRPLLEIQRRSSQVTTLALTVGVNAITLGIIGQAMVVLAEASLILALVVGLMFVDPVVTLFTVAFFGVLALILQKLLGNWAQRLGDAHTRTEIDSMEAVQHSLRAYREVTVLGRRSQFVSKFKALRWQAASVQADTYVMNQVGKYVFEVGLIVGAGMLVFATVATRDLPSAIAIATVYLAAASRVFPGILRLQTALVNIKNSAGVAQPTFDLLDDLDREGAVAPPAETLPVSVARWDQDTSGFEGSVGLVAVSVSYPGTVIPALRDVTLRVLPGQFAALVGPTGSGKSTLADLILGIIQPDSGISTISGLDPRDAIRKWPGAIAYVPQDVAVLSGTVRDNVALGLPEDKVDDELVWEALDRAHMAGFLRDSREGLETVVGEHGVQLSGGQRQRLGIARALYSRPRLIVLDEATSALDAETERGITETLEALSGAVTLIVIAHRLATVRDCDQVVYLDSGLVRAQGAFEEVRREVPDFDRQAKLLGL